MKNKIQKVIRITLAENETEGELVIPEGSLSLVIFSHGSGSSRFSTRNNFVARVLNDAGIGTFLFDLLTKEEEEVYENRFNIDLLTARLVNATKYLIKMKELKDFSFGYFGASTGAASALNAAAMLSGSIHAVVLRGGRPDLATPLISHVQAPTLFIVGELDNEVIKLNHQAYKIMQCDRKFELVKGATHLFEEPGTLKKVAELASQWFSKYLLPVGIIQKRNA